jgi:hypothetical protein
MIGYLLKKKKTDPEGKNYTSLQTSYEGRHGEEDNYTPFLRMFIAIVLTLFSKEYKLKYNIILYG